MLWDINTLTRPHERALTLLFAELERGAAEQLEVFLGTPETLSERTNEAGRRFWVHRYSNSQNQRQELYLGKISDPVVTRRVIAMRSMMD